MRSPSLPHSLLSLAFGLPSLFAHKPRPWHGLLSLTWSSSWPRVWTKEAGAANPSRPGPLTLPLTLFIFKVFFDPWSISAVWPQNHHVAKLGLKFLICLPPPSKCWDYRQALPCLATRDLEKPGTNISWLSHRKTAFWKFSHGP